MNQKDTDILRLDIHEIHDYMKNRNSKTIPEWMAEYIDWMEKARDWYYRNHSEGYVVNQLQNIMAISTGRKISRFIAKKVFADMMNFFYANVRIRKQAWRGVLVEKLQLAATAQFDAGDYEDFRRTMETIHKFLELDKPDDEGANRHLLDRRPIVYYTNPEDIGIKRVSRNELARLIDSYDIREAERRRVKMEAGVLERKLFPERSIEDVEAITSDDA